MNEVRVLIIQRDNGRWACAQCGRGYDSDTLAINHYMSNHVEYNVVRLKEAK